ncbi:hypothetical protein ACS0TY_012011 [Phlomoides rotata]
MVDMVPNSLRGLAVEEEVGGVKLESSTTSTNAHLKLQLTQKQAVTLNSFEKGKDGGGPFECDNNYYSDV